ncbi:MAG: hypothetical protein AAF827_12400 [Cyanobacteria bacterium P01_D01_bin.6]
MPNGVIQKLAINMNQANSIRTLEKILGKALEQEENTYSAINVLAKAMDAEANTSSLMLFFEILSRSLDDIKKLNSIGNLQGYMGVMADLQEIFVNASPLKTQWTHFSSQIKSKNIVLILNSLANEFSRQNPEVLLEKDFLKHIKIEFNALLEKVSDSDLTGELKFFLIKKIKEVLLHIEKYNVYGTSGLTLVVQSTLWNLYKKQKKTSVSDKNNSILKQVISAYFALESIISGVEIVETYVVPKFKEYTQKRSQIERIIEDISDLSDISDSFSDLLSLPPAQTETPEQEESDKDNSSNEISPHE